jgi:MYXO-CTERM domain-containing protein
MKAFLLTQIASVAASALQAATLVNVSFTAAGSSRFSDYYYNEYARLDSGNFLYAIADGTHGPPGGGGAFVLANQQVGSAVVFPAGANWSNVGSFTLSGTATGVGVENFTITGASFNFSPFMNYDGSALAQAFGDYATLIAPGGSGTIQFTDGMVTDLSFLANIAMVYGDPEMPSFLYPGTLEIDEGGFELHAEGTDPFFAYYTWQSTGSASFAAVPEPSVAMLGLVGIAAAVRRRRR